MNHRQRSIVEFAVILLAVAILFPPMRFTEKVYVDDQGKEIPDHALPAYNLNHWSNPAKEENKDNVAFSFIGTGTGGFLVERLLFEIVGIVAVAGAAHYLAGSTKTKPITEVQK